MYEKCGADNLGAVSLQNITVSDPNVAEQCVQSLFGYAG